MKKWKVLAALGILLCILIIPACSKRTDVKEDAPFIYGLNAERTGLKKIRYEIKDKDPLEAAKAMLKEMKTPATDITYTNAIPEKVNINKCELEGQILRVDFSDEYADIPKLEEKLVQAAIVQSLVKIDGVSALWMTVNGKEILNAEGKIAGYLNEDDYVRNTGESVSTYQTETLTLYFANESGDKLVPCDCSVKYSSNTPKEKLIVEKLLKGPKKGSGKPTLNPDTVLLGVTIKDGICYVNFDGQLLNAQVDVKPEITIYSIVNSLVEGTVASKVQITVNGEKNVKYKQMVDLTKPFQRESEWILEGETS